MVWPAEGAACRATEAAGSAVRHIDIKPRIVRADTQMLRLGDVRQRARARTIGHLLGVMWRGHAVFWREWASARVGRGPDSRGFRWGGLVAGSSPAVAALPGSAGLIAFQSDR